MFSVVATIEGRSDEERIKHFLDGEQCVLILSLFLYKRSFGLIVLSVIKNRGSWFRKFEFFFDLKKTVYIAIIII